MADQLATTDAPSPGRPTARAQGMLDRIDRFVADELAPLEKALSDTGLDDRLEPDGSLPRPVWALRREVARRSAAAGIYAAHLPEDMGGGGFSRYEMQFVEEAVYRRGLGLAPSMLAWTEGPSPMLARLDSSQRERFLGPLLTGEKSAAFANTEPGAGSDVLGLTTTARRTGGDWVIDGRKAWITNTPFCDLVQVTAVTEPGAGTRSLTLFLVESDQPGFSRGPTYGTIMDDGLTGELLFDGVRVPDTNRVGEVGEGFFLAMTYINWRRLCRGGMCAGWGRLLVERAVERLRSRVAYGRPLAAIQVLQHALADMHADWYTARAMSLVAQAEVDSLGAFAIPVHPEVIRLISLVKLVNDQAFLRICDRAVQLHGASGLRKGTLEERLFRIARNLRIPAGTDEIQRNTIAEQLLRRA